MIGLDEVMTKLDVTKAFKNCVRWNFVTEAFCKVKYDRAGRGHDKTGRNKGIQLNHKIEPVMCNFRN